MEGTVLVLDARDPQVSGAVLVDLRALHAIRMHELERVKPLLPANGRVLEIGGGTGWQAQALAATGFEVESIDLPQGPYRSHRVFPVRDYDGAHLPFADASFDAIFSSNVLEHVIELPTLLAECRRVLRNGGVCVHLMPTTTWRFWTSVVHYFWLPKAVLAVLLRRSAPDVQALRTSAQRQSGARLILRALFATRHGERGNALTELWWFSARAWRRTFRANGWAVRRRAGVGLFYTGYLLAWPWLSIRARRALAAVLGDACAMYVVQPAGTR